MGVRPAGVLRLGRRRFEPWQLLVMAVAPGPAAEGGQTSSAAEGGQTSSAAEGGQTSSAAEGGQTSSAAEGGQTSMDPDPAVAMEWVHSAVAEGADIVEVPGVVSVAPFVATVRDAYPELVIGVRTGRGEVAREACAAGADLLSGPLVDVAAELGVGVVGSLTEAAQAVAAGWRRSGSSWRARGRWRIWWLRGGRCWFRSRTRTWPGIWRGRRFSGGWGHGCSGFSGCGRPGGR